MISGNLEYLVSSLPNLTFKDSEEERKKISSILRKYAGTWGEAKSLIDILDNEAKKFLTSKQYDLLCQIDLKTIHEAKFQKSKYSVVAAFSKFAFSLKEAIRSLRMLRRKGKVEPAALKNLSLHLTPGTPLEEEIQIMKFQWDKLEALSIGHYADFGALVIYKLKLTILLRWWSFDMNQGFEVFTQITKKN